MDTEENEGKDPEQEVRSNGNQRENQEVHTKSISIKDVLKGAVREIPVADLEIDEADQVIEEKSSEEIQREISAVEIQQAWDAYAASMEKSHPRIYSTLQQHKPKVDSSGKIEIVLNSQAQKDNFIQNIKPGLTRYFQENLADVEYVFDAKLVENETTGKKIYTDQDKLEYMISKNKDLEKLKTKFNLDFDN